LKKLASSSGRKEERSLPWSLKKCRSGGTFRRKKKEDRDFGFIEERKGDASLETRASRGEGEGVTITCLVCPRGGKVIAGE